MQGQAVDIAIQAENLIKIKQEMAELIAEHSGQTAEQINLDSDRDRWFSAEEARDYGLLDNVISRAGELAQDHLAHPRWLLALLTQVTRDPAYTHQVRLAQLALQWH